MDLFALGIGAAGALLGYAVRTALDYLLKARFLRLEQRVTAERKDDEASDYARVNYYSPLARSTSRLLSRIHIALNDLGGNFGYSEIYLQQTFCYELCNVCFYLDAPDHDPRLRGHDLGERHEKTLRTAITALTGLPLYSQKLLSERISQQSASDVRPLSFSTFCKSMFEIMDVEYVESRSAFKGELLRYYHEKPEHNTQEVHEGISQLTWMALKCEERELPARMPRKQSDGKLASSRVDA